MAGSRKCSAESANRTRQIKARLSDDVGIYLDFDSNRPAVPAK